MKRRAGLQSSRLRSLMDSLKMTTWLMYKETVIYDVLLLHALLLDITRYFSWLLEAILDINFQYPCLHLQKIGRRMHVTMNARILQTSAGQCMMIMARNLVWKIVRPKLCALKVAWRDWKTVKNNLLQLKHYTINIYPFLIEDIHTIHISYILKFAPTRRPMTIANGGKVKDFVLKATLHSWQKNARRLVASVDRPIERIPTYSSKYD